MVRSTWDYAARRDEFLAWARSLGAVANPYRELEYSSDKHYLGDLAARGVPIVATTFCRRRRRRRRVRRATSSSSRLWAPGRSTPTRYGTGERRAATEHVRAPARRAAATRWSSPTSASVDDDGEHALVFVDGAFTHAMTKAAMLNTPADGRTRLFRVEAMSRAEPEQGALEVARAALAGFDGLLYARVDLVRDRRGWAVLELELVEPSLFLTHHPPAAARLAGALARR